VRERRVCVEVVCLPQLPRFVVGVVALGLRLEALDGGHARVESVVESLRELVGGHGVLMGSGSLG
jgi:hypothetical protein